MSFMSPPPTAGSLASGYNTPRGPPMPPPMMPGSGIPMATGSGMPMLPSMMQGNPAMSGSYAGYGQPMNPYPQHFVEVRHAPNHNRPENQDLPDHRRVVKEHQVILPDGSTLPEGSKRFDLYGALEDLEDKEREQELAGLKRRRRLNCIPALHSLFLPWVLFLSAYSLAAFYFHYTNPTLVNILLAGITLLCFLYAYLAWQTSKQVDAESAFYPTYLAVMFVIAVTMGWLLGDMNFWLFMQSAYNIDHLATYNNVNPSISMTKQGQQVPTSGRRYQDAGKVYFEHNAVLDLNRSMSFKMGDLYCVAPIVDPTCNKDCGHDFWAVGINCCAEDVADFRCGEYDNSAAKSGLRLMHDEQRPNFRLAVLQAEGVHNVVSAHPVFFVWTHNPVEKLEHIKKQGFKGFVILMIVSFFLFMLCSYCGLKRARSAFF